MTSPVSTSTARFIPALRKAVDTLIKIDPRIVVLTPHTKVDKGGGLYDYEEERPRAAQTFNIEPASSSADSTGETTTLGGAEVQRWTYTMLGRYDSQVEIGDTWEEGETTYRVVSLGPKNDYEKRATVVAFGKDPNYGV